MNDCSMVELLESSDFHNVFKRFRNHDIENLNILLDACKKVTVTCMELFKNSENPDRVFMNLKLEKVRRGGVRSCRRTG